MITWLIYNTLRKTPEKFDVSTAGHVVQDLQLLPIQSYIPSCSHTSTRKSTISCWFEIKSPSQRKLFETDESPARCKTYGKRNTLGKRFVASKQTIIGCIPTAKPKLFSDAETQSAGKNTRENS